jgi:hypothetical protein
MNIVTKPSSIMCACIARCTTHGGYIAIARPKTTLVSSQAMLDLMKARTNQVTSSPVTV